MLDFLVIGAGKSATTTLFEWAKHHPDLYMPENKEAPFYNDDSVYERGLDWYTETYFAKAGPNQIKGTMTPQYMLGKNETTPDVIAKRIQKDFPKIKLIAVLRHPIKRSFSHHKMALRRGNTTNTFEEDISSLLENANLEQERKNLTPQNNFLLSSEYGRILSSYYQLFEPDQILILFTEDMKKNPEHTLQKFFNFIGVDEYIPPNIRESYHEGGGKAKLKLLTPSFLYKIPLIETAWKSYIPHSVQKTIESKINRWNVKADNEIVDQDSDIYMRLVNYFSDDIQLLEQLIRTSVPWEEWN